ncbi:hypothetical protein [Rhizobium sp. 2MFCol3.1]|uniref:hypothetical protein n=1 Tax=Rhizobium sp. 2MFCol3.1 TaxID=1246459 RepID=UPI000365E1D1|nr:hypothetical protein [Rhizobium sp. 2MFCol3.1]
MSKVLFNIAGGHMRGEIKAEIDNNPSKTHADVVSEWIERRYGGWVRKHMQGKTFIIADVIVTGSPTNVPPDLAGSFTIDFENPNDEDFFVHNVGGKIIPSVEVSNDLS